MKNITKTILFTTALSLTIILIVIGIQFFGQNKIIIGCSYLDQVYIDYLAFFAAIFFVIEGIYRISEHKNFPLKKQSTRSIRIAIGFAIITLHMMQFFYK